MLLPGASDGRHAAAQPADLKKNQVARFSLATSAIWVSRTGYTGEDGFEVVAPAAIIEAIWNQCSPPGGPAA